MWLSSTRAVWRAASTSPHLGCCCSRRATQEREADNLLAVLPATADDLLIAAAARLAAAGYRISGGGRALPDRHDDFAFHDGDLFDEEPADDKVGRPALSPRESEVLALLAEGAPNKVIAQAAEHFRAHGEIPRRRDPDQARCRQPHRCHRHCHAAGPGAGLGLEPANPTGSVHPLVRHVFGPCDCGCRRRANGFARLSRAARCRLGRKNVAQGKDAVHLRRVARHWACDCAARGARRRQCDDRRQDRRAASEAAGHDLYGCRRDRAGWRQGAARLVRHSRGGAGRRRRRQDRRKVRRHRHLRQQCQRHPAHRHAGDRHEALRSDAPDQHARHVPGVQNVHSAPEVGQQSSHPESGAAARHEGQMVQEPRCLHDGQVRHVDVHAGDECRVRQGRHRASIRCGRSRPSTRRQCAICWVAPRWWR